MVAVRAAVHLDQSSRAPFEALIQGGNLEGILSESQSTSDDLIWLYRASSDPS
jgi:hypothetical protein